MDLLRPSTAKPHKSPPPSNNLNHGHNNPNPQPQPHDTIAPTPSTIPPPPTLTTQKTKPQQQALPQEPYSHPAITALTLNTRGMHTTIIDLQDLLNKHPHPHIIALTETKHRRIKSIWRHTLRNYKLIYNPSLYNKTTKRASGGTILAIHSPAYKNIEPIQVPTPYHAYLAIAKLTPKHGTPLIAISAYLPQSNTPQGKQTYHDTLTWLATFLTQEHTNLPILLGGDLQGTPAHHPTSHNTHLADFCTKTSLAHIGDPTTPTYLPSDTPLDHWLLRLPPTAQHTQSDATITPMATNHSDHCALAATIPQTGDKPAQTSTTTTTIPTTRTHPPFLLPIPKNLIDLYQLGDTTTNQAQTHAFAYLADLANSSKITHSEIDKAADHIITMLNTYHTLAQQIWPMAQPGLHHETEKMHTPLSNSDNRQLKRLTKLRNDAKRHTTKSDPASKPPHKQTPEPVHNQELTHTQT